MILTRFQLPRFTRVPPLGRALLVLGAAIIFWSGPGVALAGTPLYPCDSDRLGFGVLYGIQNYDVAPLRAGWYVNWGAAAQATHPAGMDFAQMIRTKDSGYSPSGAALLSILDRTPGSLWLIGNEPDCPYQDNTSPANYARIYHDAYAVIKGRDPLAQVAIGGIVQGTPLRMQWLDQVWNEYQARYGEPMPVDVWNVHAFVLREVRPGHGVECRPAGATEAGEWGSGIPPGVTANCGQWIGVDELDRMDLFAQQIVRFRTWMRDHGKQNKPLVVTEYGILFNQELGYDYERVRDYMLATFDYFLSASDPAIGYPADGNRLVQRWAWYSLDDTSFVWGTTHSALMDPQTRALKPLGADFARYASRLSCPAYVDLQPFTFRATTPAPIAYSAAGTVRLALEVRNQGNTASGTSQVRFWEGDPDQGGVLLGVTPLPAVPARYQGVITATLDWPTTAQGRHVITAQVDALGQVAESREDNNRSTWIVDFGAVNLAVGAAGWQLVRGPLRPGEATQLSLNPVTVTMTQPSTATTGLTITPPAFLATWYDGDPAAGGQVIASRAISAPIAFGKAQTVPAQSWAPVITATRSTWFPTALGQAETVAVQPDTIIRPAWLVVGLADGAAETTLSDNRVGLNVPVFTDLILLQAQYVGGIPLPPAGGTADVALRFQARNLGTRPPIVPVEVGVWQGASRVGPPLGRVKLAASGDWSESFIWPGLAVGAYPFVAVINPDGTIPESVSTNNQLAGVAMVAKVRYYLPVGIRR